jgi:hypothetical protein
MRFRVASLLAGVAVLALSAGGVLAAADTEDQHQDSGTVPWDAGDQGAAQTFTAGASGHIDKVSLWGLEPGGSSWGPITVDIRDGSPTGTVLGTSSAVSSAGDGAWISAEFNPAVQVTDGSTYAIVLNTSGGGAVRIGGTCAAGAYAGGEALGKWNGGWVAANNSHFEGSCITDFAFRTYEVTAPTQTTKLQWDKTQITAGKTTALTLTETFTFTEIVGTLQGVAPAGPAVSDWTIQQVALPAWFTVTSVSCLTPQIAPADCVLANVAVGASLPLTPDGNPVIVKLIGTASPDPSAGGTTGSATGEGCKAAVTGDPEVCITDQATVAVGAFDVTAAPTATESTGPSRDSAPPYAFLACLVCGCFGLAAVEFQRRSIRR